MRRRNGAYACVRVAIGGPRPASRVSTSPVKLTMPRAKQGEGMDNRKLVKMINFLRGRINGKDETRRDEAQGVLEVYESLGGSVSKADFLRDFEINGGGKGKDALKFAATFKKTAESDKTVNVSVVDNYCTGPLRLPFCFFTSLVC